MKRISVRHIAVVAAMFVALAASAALKPTQRVAVAGASINLETMIPMQFGDWRGTTAPTAVITPAEIKQTLERLYSQTLARTYVNSRGDRIMLSVAYGGEQSESLQAHRPEVCYYAQGFRVSEPTSSSIQFSEANIPVAQLIARQGARVEPITYWITVGDTAISGFMEQKIAQMRYGLLGEIPDGILVRVSNISGDSDASYRTHAVFVNDLLAGMGAADRRRLIGVRQL